MQAVRLVCLEVFNNKAQMLVKLRLWNLMLIAKLVEKLTIIKLFRDRKIKAQDDKNK